MKPLLTERECDEAIKVAQVVDDLDRHWRDFLSSLPHLHEYETQFKRTGVMFPQFEMPEYDWGLPILVHVHGRQYVFHGQHVWLAGSHSRTLVALLSVVPTDTADTGGPLVEFMFTPEGRGRIIGDPSLDTLQIRSVAFKKRFMGLMIGNAQQRLSELRD
jgi:hypothetical protein